MTFVMLGEYTAQVLNLIWESGKDSFNQLPFSIK